MEDYLELAAHLGGVSDEDPEIFTKVEDFLLDRWEIDLATFGNIADTLLSLTPTVPAPMSGENQHVFWVNKGDHYLALARKKAKKEHRDGGGE